MKKITLIVGIALMIVTTVMISCGKKDQVIKPKSISIKGDLGKYFQVVEHDYKFNLKGMYPTVSIEVKRNEVPLEFSTEKLAECRGDMGKWEGEEAAVGFGYELFDENGLLFSKNALDFNSPNGSGEVLALLKLNNGESGYITLYVPELNADYKKVTSFQLSSAYSTQISGKNEKKSDPDEDMSKALDAADKAVDVMSKVAKTAKDINDLK